MPPDLPWEVIERVVGHSTGHAESLRNFSLACRDLRRRALYLMVTDATFWTRDKVFDFCDFLRVQPHMKAFVRSIAVTPNHFAPVPLLRILPNLSELTLARSLPKSSSESSKMRKDFSLKNRRLLWAVLHPAHPVMKCCLCLGTNIQILHLSDLTFPTYVYFCHTLIAFTNLTHVTCTDVIILVEGRNWAHLSLVKARLSKQLQLKSLTVSPAFTIGRMECLLPNTESITCRLKSMALCSINKHFSAKHLLAHS